MLLVSSSMNNNDFSVEVCTGSTARSKSWDKQILICFTMSFSLVYQAFQLISQHV